MIPTALALALSLVKTFEGCRLTAYQDIVGVWTIGYGDTQDVHPGLTITQAEADSRLSTRLQTFQAGVLAACPSLGQDGAIKRLAACTSFAYNEGLHAFATSTVCRQTTAGNYQAAADALLLWNMAGGKVVSGLVNRRKTERDVYLGVK